MANLIITKGSNKMTTWQPISEVGNCADILAAFFDQDGFLQEVSAMTLMTTERGVFWAYMDILDDREDSDGWPFEPWDCRQPEYFVPLPSFPAEILERMEGVK